MKTENYLRQIILLLFSNKYLVLLSMACVITTVFISFFIIAPVYRIEGAVLVKSKKVPSSPESAENQSIAKQLMPPTVEDILLETRILSNSELIRQTIIELYEEGAFQDSSKKKNILNSFLGILSSQNNNESTDTNEQKINSYCDDVAQRLNITIFPGSNIIDVSLSYNDPVLGTKIINRLFKRYIPFRLQLFTDESANMFYSEKVDYYRNVMQEIDSSIVSIMLSRNVSDATRELQVLLQFINQYTEEKELLLDGKYELQNQISSLHRLIQLYDSASKGDLFVVPLPVLQEKDAANKRLNELLLKYYLEMKKYAVTSQGYRDLAKQIGDELQSAVVSEVEAIKMLEELISDKQRRLDNMKKKSIVLQQIQMDIDKIKIDTELNRKKYETFSMKFEESKIEKDAEFIQWANVQIFNWPKIPLEPFFPQKKVLLMFAIISGIFLGLSLAWTKEMLNHTFKTSEQITDILGLQVIGSIMRESKKSRTKPDSIVLNK